MLRNLRSLVVLLTLLATFLPISVQGKDPARDGLPTNPPRPNSKSTERTLYQIHVRAFGKPGEEQFEASFMQPNGKGLEDWQIVKAGDFLVDTYYRPSIAQLVQPGNKPHKYRLKFEVKVMAVEDEQGQLSYHTTSRQVGANDKTPPLNPDVLVKVGAFLIEQNGEPAK